MKLLNCTKITKTSIHTIFNKADYYLHNDDKIHDDCKGKILCNIFSESNSYTMLSFETAMYKLGGQVINTITSSHDNVYDKVKLLEQLGDIITLQHNDSTLQYEISKIIKKAFINAGNGIGYGNGEHPTQALLDLYTISKYFNIEEEPITILLVGDITKSQTIHSLETLLKLYVNVKVEYYSYSQPNKNDKRHYINDYTNIHLYDVVYITPYPLKQIDIKYILSNDIVGRMKKNAIIMNPFPRMDELPCYNDTNERSVYFKQFNYGVYVRMSILYCLLFKTLDNTFDTLEYNYQNQLLSEIHCW